MEQLVPRDTEERWLLVCQFLVLALDDSWEDNQVQAFVVRREGEIWSLETRYTWPGSAL